MKKRSQSEAKENSLQEHGSLNPHPERVTDGAFSTEDFFDPRDLLQVKYEMLRRVRSEGQSISRAAAAFGFSRPAFYQAQAAFEAEGLHGLLSRRRGPKNAHKLTAAVMGFIERTLEEDAALRAPELAERVEEAFGVRVHPRSIERALARRQKKRRSRKARR
jgi:transposase